MYIYKKTVKILTDISIPLFVFSLLADLLVSLATFKANPSHFIAYEFNKELRMCFTNGNIPYLSIIAHTLVISIFISSVILLNRKPNNITATLYAISLITVFAFSFAHLFVLCLG